MAAFILCITSKNANLSIGVQKSAKLYLRDMGIRDSNGIANYKEIFSALIPVSSNQPLKTRCQTSVLDD